MTTVGDEARQILQASIDQKVDAVEAYVAAQTRRATITAQLHAAEAAEAEAWQQLKRVEWSDPALKALGLAAPSPANGKRPAARQRKRPASADDTTQQS